MFILMAHLKCITEYHHFVQKIPLNVSTYSEINLLYRRKQLIILICFVLTFLPPCSLFYYTPIKLWRKFVYLGVAWLLVYLRIYYTGYSKRIEHSKMYYSETRYRINIQYTPSFRATRNFFLVLALESCEHFLHQIAPVFIMATVLFISFLITLC